MVRIPAVLFASLAALISDADAQNIRTDPMTAGPSLEIEHLYNGRFSIVPWPASGQQPGIAVSSTGRKFSCFPAGLDPTNTYNGVGLTFQVAELTSDSTEVAYPNASDNPPPGGSVDPLNPTKTKGDRNHLLGVQGIYIDELDTLWLLDTGRVISLTNPAKPMLLSQTGGPKLISIDLKTNQARGLLAFPVTPDLSGITGGQGAAYISDSSLEGRNGIIIVDIGTGKSWRQLDDSSTVHSITGSVPFVRGASMYQIAGIMKPGFSTSGVDGITLSPDGSLLYYSVIGGRFLYSVSTSALRQQGTGAATASVKQLGEKGISDGLECDTNGIVYAGNAEQNAISMYNPATQYATIFVRDPRIN